MKAIINGKVITVTGQTYDKATVLVENGKIKAVGPDIAVPQEAEIIDAAGCWASCSAGFRLQRCCAQY